MKRFLFLNCLVLVLVVNLASCSKEKITTAPAPVPVITVNEKLLLQTDIYYDLTTFEYYPDRKLKSYSYTLPSGQNCRYEFTYSGNTVTDTYFFSNKKSGVFVFTLNSKGYAASNVYTDYDVNGNAGATITTQYMYDNKDQLVKEIYSNGSSFEYVYGANGNLAELHAFNANGIEYWLSKYEYYMDKLNKPMSFGMLNSNGLGGFRPQLAKNLVKRQWVTDLPVNTVTFDATFTYELDAQGFITKGKQVDVVSGLTKEWTNTYQ